MADFRPPPDFWLVFTRHPRRPRPAERRDVAFVPVPRASELGTLSPIIIKFILLNFCFLFLGRRPLSSWMGWAPIGQLAAP